MEDRRQDAPTDEEIWAHQQQVQEAEMRRPPVAALQQTGTLLDEYADSASFAAHVAVRGRLGAGAGAGARVQARVRATRREGATDQGWLRGAADNDDDIRRPLRTATSACGGVGATAIASTAPSGWPTWRACGDVP